VPPPYSRLRKQFELHRYARLKPAHMYSRKYAVADAGTDVSMVRWQHEPIHTSLTLLQSPESRRLAVKVFRNILAFMGDRPLSKPLQLAQEVLEAGLAVPELRDEILLQLAKQLSGNPSIASGERGWVLLYLALATFPPSEDMENHIELFLRDHGALPCVWALHLTLYRGGPGAEGPIPAATIAAVLERARAPALPNLLHDGAQDSPFALASPSGTGARPQLHDGYDGVGSPLDSYAGAAPSSPYLFARGAGVGDGAGSGAGAALAASHLEDAQLRSGPAGSSFDSAARGKAATAGAQQQQQPYGAWSGVQERESALPQRPTAPARQSNTAMPRPLPPSSSAAPAPRGTAGSDSTGDSADIEERMAAVARALSDAESLSSSMPRW
jgi:hypothetical protein